MISFLSQGRGRKWMIPSDGFIKEKINMFINTTIALRGKIGERFEMYCN